MMWHNMQITKSLTIGALASVEVRFDSSKKTKCGKLKKYFKILFLLYHLAIVCVTQVVHVMQVEKPIWDVSHANHTSRWVKATMSHFESPHHAIIIQQSWYGIFSSAYILPYDYYNLLLHHLLFSYIFAQVYKLNE